MTASLTGFETFLIAEDDFDSLVLVYQELGHVPEEYLMIEPDVKKRKILSECVDALVYHRSGMFSKALDILLALTETCPLAPNRFLGFAADCSLKCNRPYELARVIAIFADNAASQGKLSLAMDAVKNIFSFAGGGTDMWMFKNPDSMQSIASILQKIADQIPPIKALPREHSKKRYAMVTVNLVDHVMAYSKTAMQWARYLDREDCECYLYFTEGTWGEKPQDFTIRLNQPTSLVAAPDFMKELQNLNVKVHLCPPVNAAESAQWLARQMEEDQIDGVIFQGGVNAAVQWVTTELSHVPVITALCLGLNMYKALDATIYMNQANMLREEKFWKEEWGQQKFICGGADRLEAKNTIAFQRKDYDIPTDATVFGLMTN